jgi:hypothetical protein
MAVVYIGSAASLRIFRRLLYEGRGLGGHGLSDWVVKISQKQGFGADLWRVVRALWLGENTLA